MKTKICFKCNKKKTLDSFYKHKGAADGHLNKCIDCTKMDTAKRSERLKKDPAWLESEKTRHREKYFRLGYNEKHKPTAKAKNKSMNKWAQAFPEKLRASSKSRHVIKKDKKNHVHHWNYSIGFEKDVIELSPKNHYKAHRFLIYDQERMMYRRNDNLVLLDSKESHTNFIMDKIKNEVD